MAVDDRLELGCGRTIDEVWAGIDRPATAHERSCGQCIAARQSLETLRAMTAQHRLLEDEAATSPDPALRPRPRVRENILAVARAEVRRGRRIPLAITGLGPILVSEQALLALIRLAADSVPGVRARQVEITPRRAENDVPGPLRLEEITCRIAMSRTVLLPQTARDVRRQVVAVLARHVSVDPLAVNIVAEDLYDV